MYYLYRHIRLDKNEVFYIGIGTKRDYYKSYEKEYSRAFSKLHRNDHWINITSLTKYEVEIMLESDSIEYIKSKEIEFIKLYGRKDLDNGTLCNWTDGGDGLFNRSSEIIKKFIKNRTGIPSLRKGKTIIEIYGKERAEEIRKNQSEGAKTKRRKSKVIKVILKMNPLVKRKITIEKMRKAKIGIQTSKAKLVNQYDLNNMFIKSFRSITEASLQTKIKRTTINANTLGKIKTAKGFIFKCAT